MRLPRIPYDADKSQREIVAVRGINYSDQIQDGDLADSLNLSARRYPYISTRRARAQQEAYSGATALTAWGKLVAVEGTSLLYDGEVVGEVSEGEKQFAVVNTKLVVWPDKVYLDLTSKEVKKMESEVSGLRVTFSYGGANTSVALDLGGGNSPSPYTPADFTEHFKAGDVIEITYGTNASNMKTVTAIAAAVYESGMTLSGNPFGYGSTDSDSYTGVAFSHKVPDLDFICESENRLWGCNSEKQTIYASALGDPTNFEVFAGLSTDSYTLAVGTDGEFTGCCKLGSSVLFWKEARLHKMLGSYPAEYSMYTYEIEGLQKGCHKSMQIINEILFYMGLHGVYAYSGGTPSLISGRFGDRAFTDAVGGNDGDSYFLSVKEGDVWRLFVYETKNGIWLMEDNTRVVDFARIGKDLYFLSDDGTVWLADTREDDPDLEWCAQLTPFYETIQGRKRYSKILLRTELPKGSYMIAEVRCDGGKWKECGKIVGNEEDVVPLRVPISRCDKFEIRLRGKGPCTILSVLREFQVGSDV